MSRELVRKYGIFLGGSAHSDSGKIEQKTILEHGRQKHFFDWFGNKK